MERPDLASITDKGWTEEVVEGESLMDSATRQTWVVVSPVQQEAHSPGEKRRAGLLISLLPSF